MPPCGVSSGARPVHGRKEERRGRVPEMGSGRCPDFRKSREIPAGTARLKTRLDGVFIGKGVSIYTFPFLNWIPEPAAA
jgi:hypothetical protein